MAVAWTLSVIVLSIFTLNSLARETHEKTLRKFLDPLFHKGKHQSDTKSLPFKRVTQLYSRNSRRHIRILPNRKVDALGEDGNKYAKLVIESDGFGRVRIRGSASNLYLCIDKKKRLRARMNGRGRNNCIFREVFAQNAFTEFVSVKKGKMYIAFNRRGKQRACNKTRSGMKAVQFIERPLKRYRLYHGRINGKIGVDSSSPEYAVCITVKTWKEWRRFLKWRKQRRNEERKMKRRRKKSKRRKTSTKKLSRKKLSRGSSGKILPSSSTPTLLSTTKHINQLPSKQRKS